MGVKVIYFLRIPRSFSKFIRVLETIFDDLGIFFLIFVLILFIFAVPLLILEKSSTFATDPMFPGKGVQLFKSLVNVYLSGMGEYGNFLEAAERMSSFEKWFFQAYFVLMTAVIQIVMLNLIIGITGMTFENVVN